MIRFIDIYLKINNLQDKYEVLHNDTVRPDSGITPCRWVKKSCNFYTLSEKIQALVLTSSAQFMERMLLTVYSHAQPPNTYSRNANMTDLSHIPADLPVPVDDDACDHLPGLALP